MFPHNNGNKAHSSVPVGVPLLNVPPQSLAPSRSTPMSNRGSPASSHSSEVHSLLFYVPLCSLFPRCLAALVRVGLHQLSRAAAARMRNLRLSLAGDGGGGHLEQTQVK